jgi:hypothetical protein
MLWAALMGALLGSCSLAEQLAPIHAALDEQNRRLAQMNNMFLELRTEHEELVRQVGCPNPAIRDFMRACATHSNFECAPQDVENTLKVMASFEHVLSYVKPVANALTLERVGQIKNLLRTHPRMSTTRLLVIAMPPGPSAADTVQAEQLARALRNQIVQGLYPVVHPNEQQLPALPPLLLGCNQREEILRRYRMTSRDRQLPGEPGDKERRILLWTFIVNC